MSLGWISVYRELTDKPIWQTSTPEQKTVLVTLMLMVNHKENEWEFKGEKYTVKPGQMITSLDSIVEKCGKGVTIQNVRTALKRFEKYGFLTNVSTNKNRLITLVNWELYQPHEGEPNKQTNKQLTSNQQAANKQLTTNNNVNNVKNEKERDNIVEIIDYLNGVCNKKFKATTEGQVKYIRARLNEGNSVEDLKSVIDKKAAQWLGSKQEMYLRPSTLFNSEKFEGYLNENSKRVGTATKRRDLESELNFDE
jgi:uncharacterized phage protein (TIGR02220 family)